MEAANLHHEMANSRTESLLVGHSSPNHKTMSPVVTDFDEIIYQLIQQIILSKMTPI